MASATVSTVSLPSPTSLEIFLGPFQSMRPHQLCVLVDKRPLAVMFFLTGYIPGDGVEPRVRH